MVCSEGDEWARTRKFTFQTLRQFGMGKNLMEQKVGDFGLVIVVFVNKLNKFVFLLELSCQLIGSIS